MVTRPFFKSTGLFVFSVMFALSLMAGTNIYSQDEPKDKKSGTPPQQGEQNNEDPMGKKSAPPPEMKDLAPGDMADHMSTMLTDKLGLNDNQKKSVYDIVLAYAAGHDRSNFNREELDSKIDEVLTAEQKDKFKDFIRNAPPKNAPPIDEPHPNN